jgi:DNA-binding response OmpR family regulator
MFNTTHAEPMLEVGLRVELHDKRSMWRQGRFVVRTLVHVLVTRCPVFFTTIWAFRILRRMETKSRKKVPRFLQDATELKDRSRSQFFFNSFRLDVVDAVLSRGNRAIFLTPKAFGVLRYLIEHAGQLVSKNDLWRAVWPGVSVTDAALTVCVSEVRNALGDKAKSPRFIETVHRLG